MIINKYSIGQKVGIKKEVYTVTAIDKDNYTNLEYLIIENDKERLIIHDDRNLKKVCDNQNEKQTSLI